MSKKKKTRNLLEMIPSLPERIGTIYENSLASIVFPRFKQAWIAKLFLSKSKKNEIRVKLDENGTKVWSLIDGKRNVKEILHILSGNNAKEENYEQRVILFLQQLHRNGFLKFSTPDL